MNISENDNWILHEISDAKESPYRKDEYYFELHFYNETTKEHYKTYITDGHYNNAWWGEVIVEHVTGSYEFEPLKTKTTKKGDLLIDGDSKPKLIMELTDEQTNTIITSKNGQRQNDPFTTIFS